MTDAQLEAEAKQLLGELEEPYRSQALENFDSEYFKLHLMKMTKANVLLCAFHWDLSKQGFDYWNDLYFKLQEEHHSNKAE